MAWIYTQAGAGPLINVEWTYMSFWYIIKSSLGKTTVVLQSKAELLHEEDGHNLIKDHKYDASVRVVKMRFLYRLLHLMFSVTSHFYNLVLEKNFSSSKDLHFLFITLPFLTFTSGKLRHKYYVCNDLLAQRMVTHLLRLSYLEKV